MSEPWCEICESEHNPKQAHRFKPVVAEPRKPKFDRTKYQRELMRKRRARAK